MIFNMLTSIMQVHFIVDMRDRGASSLLGPAECLTHIHALLKALIAIHGGQNADGKQPGREVFFSEVGIYVFYTLYNLLSCHILFIHSRFQ